MATCPVTAGVRSVHVTAALSAEPSHHEAALSPFAIISVLWAGTLKLCKSVLFLIKLYYFLFITLDSRSDFMTGSYH